MSTVSCERCGYTAESSTYEATGCPRCAERAVRSQLRRFAALQATHLRALRSRAGGVTRRARTSPQRP